MITKLKIANFKSHRMTELDLGNLTLLTGINGNGKTSVIQALLLLRQSFQKGRLMDGLDLNKPLSSVGIIHDALYRLAKSGDIIFDFSTEESSFYLGFDASKDLKASFIPKKKYSDNVSVGSLSSLSLFNNDFQYISAARWGGKSNFPKETYTVEMQKQISLEYGQGELTGHFLYKYGGELTENYIKEGPKEMPLLDQVIYWERQISPDVTINVEQAIDNSSYNITYGFEAKDGNKPLDNLRAENIGYGISYTLPVIVALLSARPGALIIIENPEAHLHPEGQSCLADLIAKVAQHGVQVLVETHSDHILNGILVACKQFEKKQIGIDRKKVRIYFMSAKDEQHATVTHQIEIDEGGILDYQPDGFFDREEKDMSYLSAD